jgi:hypothetical protein
MRDFQEIGSELAFLAREDGPRDGAGRRAPQEFAMLAAMSALRSRFLPAARRRLRPARPGY